MTEREIGRVVTLSPLSLDLWENALPINRSPSLMRARTAGSANHDRSIQSANMRRLI
jgi:hypothetical protein